MIKCGIKPVVLIILFLSITFQFLFLFEIRGSNELNYLRAADTLSNSKEWIKNPNFTTSSYWFSELNGEVSDLDAFINNEEANFRIIGEKRFFTEINGTPQNSDWVAFSNPNFPVTPDTYVITAEGCRVEHTWDENADQTRNTPSVQWKRNITMPVDINDYIITESAVSSIFNASVQASPTNGGIDTPNDGIGQFSTGDFAKFYIYVSDPEENQYYQIASNQTRYLGQDSNPTISSYGDTLMNTVPTNILVAFLNSALQNENSSFIVIIGVDIYCEDNISGVDVDTWNYLIVRALNLSFAYEKNIDRFSTISFKQIGDRVSQISEYPVIVKDAKLNFKYKANKLWNSSLSPNSEIRILINDNQHPETVKLSSATTSYQQAKVDEFDVTKLITDDVNLSIQVYLADEFSLDENFTLSVDDISLTVAYDIITPNADFSWLIYTLTGTVAGLVIIFISYQNYFKYPPVVRKVRKLRKKIRKSKKTKPILVSNRESLIKKIIHEEIKPLDLNQIGKIPKNSKK